MTRLTALAFQVLGLGVVEARAYRVSGSKSVFSSRIYFFALVALTLLDDDNSPYNAITPSSPLAQRNAEAKELRALLRQSVGLKVCRMWCL